MRWAEAHVELEAELSLEAGVPDLHLNSAAAYEGLGQSDLAALHRRRAKGKGAETTATEVNSGR
jgi:hypothetical protein